MKTEEDEAFEAIERRQNGFQAKRAMAADKLQEPVARVTGVYGGRFTYDPINRAMVLPIGMALYAAPPQRKWVGLTDKEIDVIYEQHHNQYGECESPNFGYERAIESKLKERNHGT